MHGPVIVIRDFISLSRGFWRQGVLTGMFERLLIITAVKAEAEAIGLLDGAQVLAAGVGRTNAAAATTEALVTSMDRRPFDAVISVGLAGALPGSELAVGDALLASACIYAEEGIITSRGFSGMSGLGFPLGDFEGNIVPVDEALLDSLAPLFHIGPIATVATCSGTNAAAAEIVRRTGALAEAMEGAAVVHAARRLKISAIELRAISNTTGDRADQHWDLDAGFSALGRAVGKAVQRLRGTD